MVSPDVRFKDLLSQLVIYAGVREPKVTLKKGSEERIEKFFRKWWEKEELVGETLWWFKQTAAMLTQYADVLRGRAAEANCETTRGTAAALDALHQRVLAEMPKEAAAIITGGRAAASAPSPIPSPAPAADPAPGAKPAATAKSTSNGRRSASDQYVGHTPKLPIEFGHDLQMLHADPPGSRLEESDERPGTWVAIEIKKKSVG
jgi:hypothetical protein